jgi:hypothetical protein
MNNKAILFLIIFSFSHILLAQALDFTTQPSLTKDGSNKWWVSFEVNQATDVEVSIVNVHDSSVVRHLAAGMLGPNAPAPLTASSLSQILEWDLKDDLGQAVSNPESLSVRVRAGVSPYLSGMVGENLYTFRAEGAGYFKFMGMAVDPATSDVFLYGTGNNMSAYTIRQYDGDGNYKRTVFPYPANLSISEVSGYGVNQWPDGRYTPKLPSSPWGKDLGTPNLTKTMVSSGSNFLWPSLSGDTITILSMPVLRKIQVKSSGALVADGATSRLVTSPAYPDPENYSLGGPLCVCLSADKKFVYLSGIYHWSFADNVPVNGGFWQDGQVFKVDLQTGVATSWLSLGTMPVDQTLRSQNIGPQYFGSGAISMKTCAAIHGVAIDDSGHVFICDRYNQRIGVYDANATLLGTVPVENPDLIEVNRHTGELYVISRSLTGYHTGHVSIRKFSGWRPGYTQVDSLIDFVTGVGEVFGAAYAEKVYMVVKQSQTSPVIWFASNSSTTDASDNSIWVIQDGPGGLTVIKDFYELTQGVNVGFDRLAVDRRSDAVYINDGWAGLKKITDWDNPSPVKCLTTSGKTLAGTDLTISPSNMLYIREGGSFSGSIARYTLDDRHAPVNFSNSGTNVLTPYIYGRFGQGYGEKGLAVNTSNQVAVMWMYTWMKYFVSVFADQATVDTAQGSALINPVPAECGGIQYDLQGNLYIGVGTRGSDHAIPQGFDGDYGYDKGVGAIIKFNAGASGSVAESGLGVDLTRQVTGAAKIYKPGLGAYGFNCWCRSPRFDVDPYGRLFIPNSITNQVTVIDNNGNEIMTFGTYGNVDSRGPGSLVPTNDIPLAWPIAAATSEDYIYVSDFVNCRLVSVKMDYVLDNIPGLTDQGMTVDETDEASGGVMSLSARPNPFNPFMTIRVFLPQKTHARIDVFNMAGRLVKTVYSGGLSSGYNGFIWDGTNSKSQKVSAGTYVYQLKANGKVLSRKAVMAK